MRTWPRRFTLAAVTTLAASPAMAAQPYEGTWCDDGSQVFAITRTTLSDMELAADGDGDCRILSAQRQDPVTWHLRVRCGKQPARYAIRLVPGGRAVINKFANDYPPFTVERCTS